MTTWSGRHRGRLEVEIVSAFVVSAAAFVLAAVVGTAARSHVPSALMGLLFIAGVLAVARFAGVVYAVPVGLVSLQAFDWYFLPPLRALDGATVFVLAVSIFIAILVAEVASRAGRRAERSEEARDLLAEEQAALRRVATLVAQESPAAEIFAAVTEELGGLLPTGTLMMIRYDDDRNGTVVAQRGDPRSTLAVGTRLPLGGENVTSLVHELGAGSGIGCPIVVDGRVWGVMAAASPRDEPLPAGSESRIGEFTELVAMAISNVEARSDLAASRARIVAAADEERRRVVRDLHDGAQQRLVHTVITLKLARRALERAEPAAPALVAEALAHAEDATAELRELVHGILPAVLTRGGLRSGVEELASRMPVQVDVGVSVGRLPPALEATAYFVVAEALTNVVKHAHARHAAVGADIEHRTLKIHVRDDGIGGARPEGSGLLGLADRVAVLDGRLRVESPAEGGTLIAAAIPLPDGHR